jgi:hypothetical protein
MAGVGINHLSGMMFDNSLRGMAYEAPLDINRRAIRGMARDALEVPQTEAAPGAGPAAKVKAWLAARLSRSDMQEFEQFMASLTGEGQDEVDVRETGEGPGPGSKRREAGDPYARAEDDDPDIPAGLREIARGPWDKRGRRVPISGTGRAVAGDGGAEHLRRQRQDQADAASRRGGNGVASATRLRDGVASADADGL